MAIETRRKVRIAKIIRAPATAHATQKRAAAKLSTAIGTPRRNAWKLLETPGNARQQRLVRVCGKLCVSAKRSSGVRARRCVARQNLAHRSEHTGLEHIDEARD